MRPRPAPALAAAAPATGDAAATDYAPAAGDAPAAAAGLLAGFAATVGFDGWERLVQVGRGVGIEVVLHEDDLVSIGRLDIDQILDAPSPVTPYYVNHA